jgi:phospholipid/cholesterol/gamma-HCH transport system ATP-binding protein
MPTSSTRNPFTAEEIPAVDVAVEHLVKNYGSLKVLRDISFKVEPGEIFVLMGPSGSGKSVLLRQIVGLERPTAGTVMINGLDAGDEKTREQIRIGYVFQAGALFNSLSVYDNLALYPREHRVGSESDIRKKVNHALQILSLDGTASKYPSDLSGGMKKRVSIARALVMEPQLLLYDEPTSELDPVMSATISEIIATLKDEYKVTSIVVTHDRDLALSISDRVGIILNGKLVHVGPPSELKTPKDPRIADFLNPKIDIKHPRYKALESESETESESAPHAEAPSS